MKQSIEVEYWVIDSDGRLTSTDGLTDHSAYVEKEFVEPLCELKTPPCASFTALRRTFLHQLQELIDVAAAREKLLVPLGTPINQREINLSPGNRGRIQQQIFGENFTFIKGCAGTHLHFEQRNVVDQLNVLTAMDPALALVNSCPYYAGRRVASSARVHCYRKCYEQHPGHGHLTNYVDTVSEWTDRLERRFAEFKNLARREGVAPSRIEESFTPGTAVWNPVRLREEMPTVEWRAPDTALPSEILRLTSELSSIMEDIHHTRVQIAGSTGAVTNGTFVIPEFHAIRSLSQKAVRYGLASPAVSTYLAEMGFTVDRYAPLTRSFTQPTPITIAEAREHRLRYADRLKRDVRSVVAQEQLV